MRAAYLQTELGFPRESYIPAGPSGLRVRQDQQEHYAVTLCPLLYSKEALKLEAYYLLACVMALCAEEGRGVC